MSKSKPTFLEARKKFSHVYDWEEVTKVEKLKELTQYNLDDATELLGQVSKMLEIEGKLLQSFQRNRALRMERAKIKSLIGVCEFWVSNKIKRGEALRRLDKTLEKYDPLKECELKVIPELRRAFELRDMLRQEKRSFTRDDYYLTMDEQFAHSWSKYFEIFTNPNDLISQFWAEFNELTKKMKHQTLQTNQKIIHFSLPNEKGKTISSLELLKNGPLVLSFFRGTFCPYCVNEMCVLTDSLPRISSLGATLVSIGADKTAIKFFRKLGVVGEILFDEGLKVSSSFRLVYEAQNGSAMEKMFKHGFQDLSQYNGGLGNNYQSQLLILSIWMEQLFTHGPNLLIMKD